MTAFIYIKPCADPDHRDATVDWVVNQVEKDLMVHRSALVGMAYVMAVETTETASGLPRVAFWGNTGGYDEVKLVAVLHMVRAMKSIAVKVGYGFTRVLPWRERLAIRIMLWLMKA